MHKPDPRDRCRTVDAKCPCHGVAVCPDGSGIVREPKAYMRCERCWLVLRWHARERHECDWSREPHYDNGAVLVTT